MIFLIPGNYKEAVQWCHEKGINPRSRELVIITVPDRILGYRYDKDKDEVHCVGTWSFRTDLHDVFERLEIMGWEMP
jgi:hypothetical protein